MTSTYGPWHIRPQGSPWRLRDLLARARGWHCADCRKEFSA